MTDVERLMVGLPFCMLVISALIVVTGFLDLSPAAAVVVASGVTFVLFCTVFGIWLLIDRVRLRRAK